MSIQRITEILENSALNTLELTGTGNEFVFHNSATATGNGNDLALLGRNKLFIFITGLSTSRTIQFKGIDSADNIYDIVGCKLGDTSFTLAISTTGINECWSFEDIQCFKSIRIVISAIGGTTPNNTVTVKGVVI